MNRWISNKRGLQIHTIEHLYPGDTLYLLSHGFTGSTGSHVIATIRSLLMDKQLSNVSIDFTNNLNESEGEFVYHTISGEVDDLEVVFDTYRDRFSKIYLVGHSMGCTISSLFALRYEVDGLLLVAPPYSMRDIIHEIARATFGDEQTALAKWDREGVFGVYKNETYHPLSYEFYRDLIKVNPKDYQDIRIPTAIIYSSADPVVPPGNSVRMYETIGSQLKQLSAIPDAPHSFDVPTATEALKIEVEKAIGFLA